MMKLDPENLNIESFDLGADEVSMAESVVIRTVLYETEQVSCGGTCGSCPCYA